MPPVIVKTEYVVPEHDESLRTCISRPERRPVQNSNDTAQLIADAFLYGDDCSSKLESTWQSIDEAKAEAERMNEEQQ